MPNPSPWGREGLGLRPGPLGAYRGGSNEYAPLATCLAVPRPASLFILTFAVAVAVAAAVTVSGATAASLFILTFAVAVAVAAAVTVSGAHRHRLVYR